VSSQSRAPVEIRRTEDITDPDWLPLRCAFWDGESEEEHFASLKKFTTTHAPYFAFIANEAGGEAVGFAEISVRRDYVNGTSSSPVLYLEGIFVLPQHRGRGISHLLCRAAEDWGARQGIREFASDSDIDNELSIKAHLGLGFEEADRVVCFRKLIEETEAPLTKPQGSENNHEE
jgi:aminoglycoside 6'-N-acetyltransferase I